MTCVDNSTTRPTTRVRRPGAPRDRERDAERRGAAARRRDADAVEDVMVLLFSF
jgi:hypothetical protein